MMNSSQDDRAKRLEQLPDWEWAVTLDEQWDQKYGELLAYVAEHGKLPPRASAPLGDWVHSQRKAYKGQGNGRLTSERIQLLEQVPGWKWGTSQDEQWSQKYEELLVYAADHGQLPPQSSGPLGRWAGKQRTAYKGRGTGKLTPERIHLLEQVPGWWWAANLDEQWNQKYEELLVYIADHGKLPSRSSGSLSNWISTQEQAYKGQAASKLTPERIQLLEQVPGWSWGATQDERWSQRYEELLAYVAEHGNLPPQSSGPLGRWTGHQRTAYKGQGKHKVTPERIQLLEQVPGWWWTK